MLAELTRLVISRPIETESYFPSNALRFFFSYESHNRVTR